jgi:hypothetical protein
MGVHLHILKSPTAPRTLVVLQYRADHGPRPILFSRHMEFPDPQCRFYIWEYRRWRTYACRATSNGCNPCLFPPFSISVQCSRSRKKRNVGVQQRRIIALARDLVEVTDMDQVERLSPRGRLDPTETQAIRVWRLCRGPRGAKRRSHKLMEEKTGGAVSRDGIWLHQS